ncbi:MAG: hypothetical protein HFI75_02390 [Lachnospiraceae bacterium]|nr:hypothetical protein [Lachnospiraceae bacterium]
MFGMGEVGAAEEAVSFGQTAGFGIGFSGCVPRSVTQGGRDRLVFAVRAQTSLSRTSMYGNH